MQKAKVALVEAGIIKTAGRGRISADGHAWLKQQYDKGVRFSDWPKGEVVVTKTKATAKKPESETVKVTRETTETGFVEPVPYRFPEAEFKAVEVGTRKERSMRSACNNCRVSLVVCHCPEPRIVAVNGGGSVRVEIVKR